MNWKVNKQPGHSHGHNTLVNREAANCHPISAIDGLQNTIDTKVTQGYGGIFLETHTVIADLNGTNWVTLPADNGSVLNPVDVDQDFATNSLSIDSEGVWLVCLSATLSHNEVNAGRVMGVRIHNLDQVFSPYVLGVPTGRNSPGTAFSSSFLVDIDGTNVTDNFVIDIGGPGDTYTNLQVTEYAFDAVHVSGRGSIGSGVSSSLEARIAALEDTSLTPLARNWTETVAELIEKEIVSTTDNQWTDIARLPVAPGTTIDVSSEIRATRQDLPGNCRLQIAVSAFDVGGTLLITDSQELFKIGNDQLRARVITDGDELVWQVRGRLGQEWNWDALLFHGERY